MGCPAHAGCAASDRPARTPPLGNAALLLCVLAAPVLSPAASASCRCPRLPWWLQQLRLPLLLVRRPDNQGAALIESIFKELPCSVCQALISWWQVPVPQMLLLLLLPPFMFVMKVWDCFCSQRNARFKQMIVIFTTMLAVVCKGKVCKHGVLGPCLAICEWLQLCPHQFRCFYEQLCLATTPAKCHW